MLRAEKAYDSLPRGPGTVPDRCGERTGDPLGRHQASLRIGNTLEASRFQMVSRQIFYFNEKGQLSPDAAKTSLRLSLRLSPLSPQVTRVPSSSPSCWWLCTGASGDAWSGIDPESVGFSVGGKVGVTCWIGVLLLP